MYVYGGGTFIMEGGTISGNTCSPIVKAFNTTAAMAYATKKSDSKYGINNTEFTCKGGGVYVSGTKGSIFGKTFPGGTFRKTGGTITSYASDPKNGNVTRDVDGNVSRNNGHAVYVEGFGKEESSKRKETTAGPEVDLFYSDGEFSGGWDE